MVHELSSDHQPILIGVHLNFSLRAKPAHTFLNYGKAEWAAYTQSIEASLRDFNPSNFPSLDLTLDEFNRVPLTASKANIVAMFVVILLLSLLRSRPSFF